MLKEIIGLNKSQKIKIKQLNEHLSHAGLKKALKNHAVSHWSFRYAVVMVLVSALSIPLFGFMLNTFTFLLASCGLLALSWVWNYWMDGSKFIDKRIRMIQSYIEEETEKKQLALKENLDGIVNNKPANQINELKEKFENLIAVLSSKFDENELTYKRYLGISYEVYLSAIDNLNKILLSHKGISDINQKTLKERLKTLDPSKRLELEEKETLEKRLNIYEQEIDRINELLLENEKAMTQIDETTIAISKINASEGEGALDMENSMKELVEITRSTHKYSQ